MYRRYAEEDQAYADRLPAETNLFASSQILDSAADEVMYRIAELTPTQVQALTDRGDDPECNLPTDGRDASTLAELLPPGHRGADGLPQIQEAVDHVAISAKLAERLRVGVFRSFSAPGLTGAAAALAMQVPKKYVGVFA